MKKIIVFLVILFIAAIHSIAAQDLMVLRDGNIIDVNVLEISATEIKYRRIDHLDGPLIIVLVSDVLSIRYQNGTTQIFTNAQASQAERTQVTGTSQRSKDQDKFIFGISANAGGALALAIGGAPGLRLEFGKGNFNAELNLGIGEAGMSGLATFNYFWPSRIGGFYLGGGLGGAERYHYNRYTSNAFFEFGLNIGYKFVTQTGIYFRTGTFIGSGTDFSNFFFSFNPDISLGWTMR